MALRAEDKGWISAEIRKAIEEHLSQHGWRKAREFIPIAGILGVFIGVLTLAGAGWNYALSRVEKETRFEAQTTDKLGEVSNTLAELQASVAVLRAQNVAQRLSSVPANELKSHGQELVAAKESLASVRQNASDYWPTSFRIITLLSQAQAASVLETAGKQPLSTLDNVGLRGVGPPLSVMDNRNVLLKNLVYGVYFENSIIHIDTTTRLANDTFVNCIFILPLEANPPKPLQDIGSALLMAADLAHVTVKNAT